MEERIELDRELMETCLSKLNEKLTTFGEMGEIVIFGGAAMCLVYGSREYTRDIDAIFEPKSDIYQMAKEVAEDLSLQEDWLNDGIKGFIYTTPPSELILTFSNLRVYSASADYILAMKCLAAREDSRDREDAIFLKNHLRLSDYEEVLDIVEKYIPKNKLSVKTVAFAQGLFE